MQANASAAMVRSRSETCAGPAVSNVSSILVFVFFSGSDSEV